MVDITMAIGQSPHFVNDTTVMADMTTIAKPIQLKQQRIYHEKISYCLSSPMFLSCYF